MLTLHNIRTAFLKKYDLVLKHCAQDLALEQIIYPINSKLYDQFIDFSILSKAVKTIIENSKEYKKNGYWILYKDINLKKFGKQKLPKSLYFETAEDYFYFLGKGEEYNFFKSNLALTIRQFPELKTWAQSKPIKLIENAHCWDSILAVCEYFTHNPSPNCFIRDIAVEGIDTKFIERNKSILDELLSIIIQDSIQPNSSSFEEKYGLKTNETKVHFKLLDSQIAIRYLAGLNDLTIPLSQFESLRLPIHKVIVVENMTTFNFIAHNITIENTIVVFGAGYQVITLKNTQWFNHVLLLYWGDIDVHGFEIYAHFKSFFPHTKSLLMNEETFKRFFQNDKGSLTLSSPPLSLTDEENTLYKKLRINNWRLEQEKISKEYAYEAIVRSLNR